jgi:hypothetical protein
VTTGTLVSYSTFLAGPHGHRGLQHEGHRDSDGPDAGRPGGSGGVYKITVTEEYTVLKDQRPQLHNHLCSGSTQDWRPVPDGQGEGAPGLAEARPHILAVLQLGAAHPHHKQSSLRASGPEVGGG